MKILLLVDENHTLVNENIILVDGRDTSTEHTFTGYCVDKQTLERNTYRG